MKRPEGFDRGAEPSAPSRASRPSAPKQPARQPAKLRAAKPVPRAERPAKPVAGPARPRTARAEFSAAERRRKREERAEVRRFTRRARRRRLGWLGALGVVAVLGILVAGAVFSPILALRQVVVDGTQRLDAAAIAKAVDSQMGVPLALLDENRIRSELEEFSLIRSYVTELVPPGTLLIHVVERAPIGVIAAADGFRMTDPAGVTIETTTARPPGYPQIELAAGEDVSGAGFRSMAEVLLALPPAVLAQVDTIAARTRDDVTLTLTGSAQRVVWGSADDSASKAAVLASLIALHTGDGPGEYDVSAPGIGVFHKD
ncbi:MAG: FtsQ-type POTRA domain-containing protein [Pseudolysinimonas sp.]